MMQPIRLLLLNDDFSLQFTLFKYKKLQLIAWLNNVQPI